MNPAHPDTLRANAKLAAELDFTDRRDFEDAERGFIATLPDAHIDADAGGVAWSMKPYGFLSGKAPETVNPSLWRMSQLNAIHGLFEVTERVYQVRGFSLANVTFIEGDTGVIVIDPLQFTEHARAAIQLYRAASRRAAGRRRHLHAQPPRPLRRRARRHQRSRRRQGRSGHRTVRLHRGVVLRIDPRRRADAAPRAVPVRLVARAGHDGARRQRPRQGGRARRRRLHPADPVDRASRPSGT